MNDTSSEKNILIRHTAAEIAAAYHCTADQVLLAFLFRHPAGIIPVLGTSKLERVVAGKDAAGISLSREEWFMLWKAAAGHDVP